MELKRKPVELLLRGICGFLALFTLFLLTLSLIFTFGGDAPSLFGKNVYIVKTDSIEFLSPGTAVFASVVDMEDIEAGNIIIFKNSANRKGIAQIVSSQLGENVYRFNAVSERGNDMILTESQIVGKATKYSRFFGALFGFAKSPLGVMLIAVIPCLAVLLYEGSKAIFTKLRGEGRQVVPVKKQDENPTYIPRQKISSAISAYSKTDRLDADGEGIAADDGFEFLKDVKEEPPLFSPPASKTVKIGKKEEPTGKTMPLSQKRLNQAIAEVNARKKPAVTAIADTPAAPEAVKRYAPKKGAPARISQTAAIPSLDRILSDDDHETENTGYNIEDILFSLDKKR